MSKMLVKPNGDTAEVETPKNTFLDNKAKAILEGADKKKVATFEECCEAVKGRRVFGAQVLVMMIRPEDELLASGLVKVQTRERNDMAKVVKYGPGEWLPSGVFVATDLHVGEEVLVTRYGGSTIEIGGIELKLMHAKQVYLGEEPKE